MRILIRCYSSAVYEYTTTEGVATEREREYTYWSSYLSPQPYSILTRFDWTQTRNKTLQERVQQNERKINPPPQQKVVFQKQNIKTYENCDQMKLESCYIKKQNTDVDYTYLET